MRFRRVHRFISEGRFYFWACFWRTLELWGTFSFWWDLRLVGLLLPFIWSWSFYLCGLASFSRLLVFLRGCCSCCSVFSYGESIGLWFLRKHLWVHCSWGIRIILGRRSGYRVLWILFQGFEDVFRISFFWVGFWFHLFSFCRECVHSFWNYGRLQVFWFWLVRQFLWVCWFNLLRCFFLVEWVWLFRRQRLSNLYIWLVLVLWIWYPFSFHCRRFWVVVNVRSDVNSHHFQWVRLPLIQFLCLRILWHCCAWINRDILDWRFCLDCHSALSHCLIKNALFLLSCLHLIE